MSASRRNRRKTPSPAHPKPIKPPSDPELAALRESTIVPACEQLKNADPSSRLAAAQEISKLALDPKCRKLFLKEQIVHLVLSDTLQYASLASRAAGWLIFETLTLLEESDFAVHLYRMGVVDAAEQAASSVNEAIISTLLASHKSRPSGQEDTFWIIIISSLLHIIASLAAARDEIHESITARRAILDLVLSLTRADPIILPLTIQEDLLSCLTVLVEDNLAFCQAITDSRSGCYNRLAHYQSVGGLRATRTCSVLHNVFVALEWRDHSLGKDRACDALLVPTLSRIISEKRSARNNASTEALLTAFEVLASIGTHLQTTFEQGNHASQEDALDDEEWNGFDDVEPMDQGPLEDAASDDSMANDALESDEDDTSEMDIDEIEADMELVTGADDPSVKDLDNLDHLPTVRSLIGHAIPTALQCAQIPLNVTDGDDAIAIQECAISAMNNIAWSISCLDFTAPENAAICLAWFPCAKNIWTNCVTPLFSPVATDIPLNHAIRPTGLAWAVARVLNGETPTTPEQVDKLIHLYRRAAAAAAQSPHNSNGNSNGHKPNSSAPKRTMYQDLATRCINIVGHLAREPAPVTPINHTAGSFLMSIVTSDAADRDPCPASAEDIIEALNQLFDLYADEHDAADAEVFWKCRFLGRLEQAVPEVRARVKAIDKRACAELRARGDEVLVNLARFVAYKRKHGRVPA